MHEIFKNIYWIHILVDLRFSDVDFSKMPAVAKLKEMKFWDKEILEE